jgi:hypothetical protein
MKDPNDTRNAAPRPGSPLWIDMTAITAAGTVVIALAAYMLRSAPHIPPLHNAALFWVVALMILAGEAWRIITPGKTGPESPAVSVTISFATLLYWGFPIAVLFRAAAIVAAGLVQRKSLHRALFNAAQISLSLGAAGLTLAAAAPHRRGLAARPARWRGLFHRELQHGGAGDLAVLTRPDRRRHPLEPALSGA